MRFTVLGRSPAVPNPGEACAGYLVEGGRSRVMVDIGPGTVAQLLRLCNPWELDAVVISHMHTDHFLDLVTMRYSFPWKDEANPKLRVYLPPGATAQMEHVALGAGLPDYFARSFAFTEHDGTARPRNRGPAAGAYAHRPLRSDLGVPDGGPRRRRGRGQGDRLLGRFLAHPQPGHPGRSGPICSSARPRCGR